MTQDPMGSISPNFGEGTPGEWLVWKDKLLKALDGQGISKGPQRYMFTQWLLTGALDIGMRTVHNFNKELGEMTKHAFPV